MSWEVAWEKSTMFTFKSSMAGVLLLVDCCGPFSRYYYIVSFNEFHQIPDALLSHSVVTNYGIRGSLLVLR